VASSGRSGVAFFGARCLIWLWALSTLGSASGCGRPLQTPAGHAPPTDAAVELGGADVATNNPTDAPIEVAPDAPAALPDGAGAVDLSPASDRDPIEAGQDLMSDRGPVEAGQDLTSDRGPIEAGQDLTSDRNPDSGPTCGSPWDLHHCGTCDHDCTALPHLGPNSGPEYLGCENGICHAYECATGYAHCSSATTDKACETSLWSDTTNCGGCGVTCGQLPGSPGVCHNGACVGECPAGFGDCTDDFGCETQLDTPYDCGACGHPACGLANVVAPCRQPAPSCDDGVCAAGYGNCDHASPDCEAAYGSAAGTCLPTYAGTVWLPTTQDGAAAVGADGTRFIGGQFVDPVDFNFTGGVDMRSPSNPPAPYHSPPSPYVTMARPDGNYGWTRTFHNSPGPDGDTTGQAGVVAVAAPADGGVIVGGNFSGSIVLDPAGVTVKSTPGQSAFIVKLDGNGAFVWGQVLQVPATGASVTLGSLVVAADGSVYVGGSFWGVVDFDPSSRTVNRVGDGAFNGSPFILKLGKDGGFAWVDTWSVPSSCVMYPGRLAVSSAAGRVWAAGSFGGTCDFNPGSGVDSKQIGDGTGGAGYVLAVDASGRYIGTWTFGNWVSDLTADDQGAVYAVGSYRDTVDFDPGAGEALRTAVGQNSSFTVKLSADGTFQWVLTQTDFAATAIALGPGGSVLVAGMLGGQTTTAAGIIELFPDQSLGWTIGFGTSEMGVRSLATTASGLFVGGSVYWDTDMDPGPGVDTVAGNSNPFVSAFAY
jgi:hypothetical protein